MTGPSSRFRHPAISPTRLKSAGCFSTLLTHLLLTWLAAIVLTPFAWLICAGVKRGDDLFTYAFLPWDSLHRLTLGNFKALFTQQPYARWLLNSLFLASTQTVLVVALSSLAGFALAKYRFRGRRFLMLIMLCTMLLPAQVLLTGGWKLMLSLGWINTYRAIIFPGTISVFGIFLFKQAMQTVPDELLQAGRVDGCSELRLWWEVALPIVRPMIGAFTLLSFLGAWNSFLWPQIVLQDESMYTLPIGLTNMMQLPEYRQEFGILMAGTLVGIAPVVILFFILQKDFIAGLASGAVKG